ncbi:MAG: SH3 domain-containing protein [Candidatus Dormibacteria bacterium]
MADHRVRGFDHLGNLVSVRLLESRISSGLQRSMLSGCCLFAESRRLFLLWLLVLVLPFALAAQGYHDPRRKTPIGFSVELPVPPDKLASAVMLVAEDGSIQGTKVYSRDPDAEGSEVAKNSTAFTDDPGPGRVFYKVLHKALSPQHFPGSYDMGAITVRYVVEAVNSQRSRLRIDAVFVEDAERKRCFSDGSVETAEYAVIMDQARALMPSAHPKVTATQVNTPDKNAGLQSDLEQEQSLLAEAQVSEQKLETQVKQLEFDTQGRVKEAGVPLKAGPYDHSSNLLMLQKGQVLTVTSTTKYWYRVRTDEDVQGWIYYLFLEPVQ